MIDQLEAHVRGKKFIKGGACNSYLLRIMSKVKFLSGVTPTERKMGKRSDVSGCTCRGRGASCMWEVKNSFLITFIQYLLRVRKRHKLRIGSRLRILYMISSGMIFVSRSASCCCSSSIARLRCPFHTIVVQAKGLG